MRNQNVITLVNEKEEERLEAKNFNFGLVKQMH
jgi:hypothetical protein